MRRSLSAGLLLGACAALLSCSTAPKQPDAVLTVKSQADQESAAGEGYYRQGRYPLALQFYSQALSDYTSVDDGPGIVRSYIGVGRCYVALGSPDQAEDMFQKAQQRAQREPGSLAFDATLSLGELYLTRGDPQQARSVLGELEAAKGTRTPSQEAQLYHDLGTAEKNLGDSPAALSWLGRSLALNLSHRFYAEAASDYYMIASVHSRDGGYDEAMRNAELALSYDKRVESSPGIAKDLYALGVISAKRGDPTSAFDYFQRSYNVSTTLGFKDDMRRALSGLVDAAEALGRASEAEAYRKALAELGAS